MKQENGPLIQLTTANIDVKLCAMRWNTASIKVV